MKQVEYINPTELPAYGYTNVAVVPGAVKTIYVGGQDAVNAKGEVVGKGDMAAQTRQIMHNLQVALAAGGASLEHIIKFNIYVVQGNDIQPGFAVFQEIWGDRPNPPLVSMAYVSGLAHPDFLAEIDAIAVVPEKG
jgi:enamine deaminase RidA (YjgF/YER057c/UK114 family)